MKKIYRIYNVKYDNKFKNFFKFLDSLSEDYDEVEILPDYLQEEFLDHKEELLNHINSLDEENYLDKLNLYFDLFDKMKKIHGIMVYESSTNFILFKILNGSAKDFFRDLLSDNILIKDVSDIEGLGDCLRVTVGSENENEQFIQSLKNSII